MPFSVIGMSETWLTHCTAELANIKRYNFVSTHRKSKTGSGVGIYLQQNANFQIQMILSHFSRKLLFPTENNVTVGCVYRPPNQNTAMSIEKFNNILSLISKDNKHRYMMEDFNLSLLQYNYHVPTQEFIDSLFSHAFLPLISNPTRLTSYSVTLIDNIFIINLAHNVLEALF